MFQQENSHLGENHLDFSQAEVRAAKEVEKDGKTTTTNNNKNKNKQLSE